MKRQIPKENLFPSKLNEILNTQLFKQIISWGENENTIQIHDLMGFQQKILPKYFRHSKFDSFARQMNLYGFKKSRNSRKQIFTNKQLKSRIKITELQSRNQKNHLKSFLESSEEKMVSQEGSHQEKIMNLNENGQKQEKEQKDSQKKSQQEKGQTLDLNNTNNFQNSFNSQLYSTINALNWMLWQQNFNLIVSSFYSY